MAEKPTYEALEKRIAMLENESAQRNRFEAINSALFKISNAVNTTSNLDELFSAIHLALSSIIDTSNFYIALYNEANDSLTFPYFVDSADDNKPPAIEISKTESITAEVIRTGRPVMVTKAERLAQRAKTYLSIPPYTPSEIWLGVPLKSRDKIVGVMTVQSYHDPKCYDQTDLDVMVSVADQVATAVERKKAEGFLRDSEERLKIFFNGINEAIFVHEGSKNGIPGRFIEVNDSACRRLGYSRDELLTMCPTDIDAAETVPNVPLMMETLYAKGSAVWEGVHVCKDGKRIAVEIANQLALLGGRYIIISTARDITDRKQAEQDYKMLFREMLDGFALHEIICNETGNPVDYRFLAVNPAFERMTGLTAESVVGKTVLEVLPGIEHHWIETYGKVALTGAPAFFENYAADLKKHFQVTAFQPVPKQFACIFSDITDRKKAQEEKARLDAQLQQAQKMEAIGSLAGGIAHDLNNILFPICGLSEMLLDEIPTDSTAYESVEQIHKSAQRGSDLVKQILTFSRHSKPQKMPLRAQPILKEVLKLFRATIPANIEINSLIDSDCGMVSADPTDMHQVSMNLITNAYHAVEQTGGTINLELKEIVIGKGDSLKPGKYACIIVSDTGTGIDQALIHKIFDPFFTTKKLGKGTGLGLSVVHGIVMEHGGDIRVYSEVGKGTSFYVYLPLLEDARDSKTDSIARKYPTGCESILLVDDEQPIACMEQMMLERLGYRVTTRTSSPDTLEVFRSNPSKFDLVISDRGMPNMTGEQLAWELNTIKPGIPIIICTGFSDENDEKRAKEIGIKGFLMKPVAIGDFAVMVRKVLDESKASAHA